MAFLLTKSSKAFVCFAVHAGFSQYRHVTSSLVTSFVDPPQTGQTDGIVKLLLCVRFSAICGMIQVLSFPQSKHYGRSHALLLFPLTQQGQTRQQDL